MHRRHCRSSSESNTLRRPLTPASDRMHAIQKHRPSRWSVRRRIPTMIRRKTRTARVGKLYDAKERHRFLCWLRLRAILRQIFRIENRDRPRPRLAAKVAPSAQEREPIAGKSIERVVAFVEAPSQRTIPSRRACSQALFGIALSTVRRRRSRPTDASPIPIPSRSSPQTMTTLRATSPTVSSFASPTVTSLASLALRMVARAPFPHTHDGLTVYSVCPAGEIDFG